MRVEVSRCRYLAIFFLMMFSSAQGAVFKGIWSDIESIPVFKGSFWKQLGYSFGMAPSGYDYSFSVYNDGIDPVWVNIQDFISIMGACLPSGGAAIHLVAPTETYTSLHRQYYFEMIIRSSSKTYSNRMPYLTHSDALARKECIQLQTKNSTQHDYYRAYCGKNMVNGQYQHGPKAEYIGYVQMSGKKDPNAIAFTTTLNSFTIENSTNVDYAVGFVSTAGLTAQTMQYSMCSWTDVVEANSFAQISAYGAIKSFLPGTLGVFDVATHACVAALAMPKQCVAQMGYTAEIFQDQGATAVSCAWQGIMSGNYDMPMNLVRDCTPITATLWYQSAKQAGGGVDLPGTVWILQMSPSSAEILAMATPGQAVQFTVNRPRPSDPQAQLCFVYIDETDQTKATLFVQKFLQGAIGSSLLDTYNTHTQNMMQQGALSLQAQKIIPGAKKAAPTKPSTALISQAVSGSLQMNQGQIFDSSTGITGFLLGIDIFLPLGAGSSAQYYELAPSIQNQLNYPTSAVQNLFAETSSTQAPTGMPTPIVYGAPTPVALTAKQS